MHVTIDDGIGPGNAGTPNLRCGVCRHRGVFGRPRSEIQDVAFNRRSADGILHAGWFAGVRRCPNRECNAATFVIVNQHGVVVQYPPEVIDFDATALPGSILATLEEAVKCHAAGAYKAAALMVRRLLEEICLDQNATGTDLKKRLAALGQNVLIPKELLEAADELRLLGNDAAHIEAKSYDSITDQEARLAVELAKEILKAVYQYASLVDKLRALRK